MGIVPRGESPWGWAPTIRFGMAADAINVSETTYLTAVLHYITNLGTTMESQVRSSVVPSVSSLRICRTFNLSVLTSLPLCASLCAAPLLSVSNPDGLVNIQVLVAACLSRTRILAVTSDLTFYQIPDE